jgi:hypothetical protein
LSQNAETPNQALDIPCAPAAGDIRENLLSALRRSVTSVRAAAEILRGNPDLPAEPRDRFHARERLSLPIPASSRDDG